MPHPVPLHGAVGYWDEIACLAVPLTVIVGIALAVLRPKPSVSANGVEHEEEDV